MSSVGLQLHTSKEEGMLVVRGGGAKKLEGCQIQTEPAPTSEISQNRVGGSDAHLLSQVFRGHKT